MPPTSATQVTTAYAPPGAKRRRAAGSARLAPGYGLAIGALASLGMWAGVLVLVAHR